MASNNRTVRIVLDTREGTLRSPFGDGRDYWVVTFRFQRDKDQPSGFAAQRHDGPTGRELIRAGALQWWSPATIERMGRLGLDNRELVRPWFGHGYLLLDVPNFGPVAVSYEAVDAVFIGLLYRPVPVEASLPEVPSEFSIDQALDALEASKTLAPILGETPTVEP